jgi:prepilin-type N-terminal cleavage/methylation domain-containing protein
MKNNRGFTLLEVAIVTGIIGIMAAITFITYQKVVAHDELQTATSNLYMELRAIRPIALKYDAKVMVKFIAEQCSIYVDTNGNGVREPAELRKVYKMPSRISIGIATSGPTVAPTGIDWNVSGIAGNWNTSVMTVNNNALGSITSGAIYLKSSRLSKITYCIGISATGQSLKLYKWGGSSWNAL